MSANSNLGNSVSDYGSVARVFHWLTALLILAAIPLGLIANGWAFDSSEALQTKFLLFSLHKTVGVTAFFVALARIVWAVIQPKPGLLHPDRRVESWLAETVHWMLYGSLVLVPFGVFLLLLGLNLEKSIKSKRKLRNNDERVNLYNTNWNPIQFL